MRTMLLTAALVALTALSACDNADNAASTEPAAGDSTVMTAPIEGADSASTTVVTDGATTTTTSDVTATSDGSVTTTTTTTTTPSEPAQGIAVGEPNPATPTEPNAACGTHDDLVGKNVSEVDQTTLSQPVRVYKSGDPVTMDYNANRTNIETDADGKIVRVHCG